MTTNSPNTPNPKSDSTGLGFPDPGAALMLTNGTDLARAAKAWRRADVLAVDTEFVRERTFYPALGLVQISDGQSIWLVDPVRIDDLSPVAEILADNRIVKVFHSPSEDFEVLEYALGVLPSPVFDTQLAAALLGQTLQLSYTGMIEWLFDEQVDKDQTRSNWVKRPLSSNQLRYAAMDVTHLSAAYVELSDRLQQQGRLEWAAEDNERTLNEAARNLDPSSLYLKVKGAGRVSDENLATLQALASWRDQQAREADLPRSFVLRDHTLVDMANKNPQDEEQLKAVNDMHPRAANRHADDLLTLVQEHQDADSPPPLIQLTGREKNLVKSMMKAVRSAAETHNIPAALLASRKELEKIVSNNPGALPEKYSGWRKPIIGEQLESMLHKHLQPETESI